MAEASIQNSAAQNSAAQNLPSIDRLDPAARGTALKLAEALLPAGSVFPGGGEATIERLEAILTRFGSGAVRRYGNLLGIFEQASRIGGGAGRPFSQLGIEKRARLLDAWAEGGRIRRAIVAALTSPIKVAHFDDPEMYRKLGCAWRDPIAAEPPARWMRQIKRGAEIEPGAEIECDAVVAGTGAGGAVAARELAERGLAVVVIEEGEYCGREAFNGRAIDAILRFYRDHGAIAGLGNSFVPIPAGRVVGGSTAINTGTCWRTPSWVLERWVNEYALPELAPDRMAPYFERVERELQVERADARFLGGVARVIGRGSDQLGYSHRPVDRNAPACDGSGVCDFGCPIGARRSTNISYVPPALERGALLYTGMRAERVIIEHGRVTGLEARAVGDGRVLRVKARATVLAGGALMTPVLLRRQGLHRHLRHIGRNLSIHPATVVSALFDEEIRGFAAIPQGYCVDQFHREGILFLGASAPLDTGAALFSLTGRKLMEVMDAYDRVASFGVMIEDRSLGRVIARRDGKPLVFYWLGRRERERLLRGAQILARIYFAAGAREVYPAIRRYRVIRSEAELAAAHPGPSDWLLTAFHPLGTCRMARSPAAGVVSPDHEVFGFPGLYIADGSVVPGSVAVNPQVTIMAMATRGAERIAARLADGPPAS